MQEDHFIPIVEPDAPALDDGQLRVYNGCIIDDHVREVKLRLIDVYLELVTEKVRVVDVSVDGECTYLAHPFARYVQVPVHIGHAILEQIVLDEVGEGLRHADLQAWVRVRQAAELDAIRASWIVRYPSPTLLL